MKKLFLFLLAAVAVSFGYAQNSETNREFPSSREPAVTRRAEKKSSKGFLFFKKRSSPVDQYEAKVDEFYQRMEDAAKRYEKMEKEMSKPQYSDPLYFGHKKPPKKRPPGKKKFCSVCKITH